MQNLTGAIVLGIIYVIWAVHVYFIARISLLGLRSKKWPVTDGLVVASESRKLKPSEMGLIVNQYRVVIRYQYIVKDSTYTSETVSFGDSVFQFLNRGLRSKRGAQYLMYKYPLNSKVVVYFDPAHPARAVLKPGISDFNLILIIIIFGVMGLLLFVPLLTRL